MVIEPDLTDYKPKVEIIKRTDFIANVDPMGGTDDGRRRVYLKTDGSNTVELEYQGQSFKVDIDKFVAHLEALKS